MADDSAPIMRLECGAICVNLRLLIYHIFYVKLAPCVADGRAPSRNRIEAHDLSSGLISLCNNFYEIPEIE